jgi:DNA-binding LacI/PurR family transcriptional regulator
MELASRVHLLVAPEFRETAALLARGVSLELQRQWPLIRIELNLLAAPPGVRNVRRLIVEALASMHTDYFVLVHMPLEVQRLVQECKLPAVLYGSPYPSITSLSSIDGDHYQGGRLAASRLIQDGLRTLTVFTREFSVPSDYAMLDGARDEMNDAGLPLSQYAWRSLPSDGNVSRHLVHQMLRTDGGPHGFICRSRHQADGAELAISEQKKHERIHAGIVLFDAGDPGASRTNTFPCLQLAERPLEIGRHLARLLVTTKQANKSNRHELVRFEIREPLNTST